MNETKVGAIGVARRTHWLDRHDAAQGWATRQCGTWAGGVTLAEAPPTCPACAKLREVKPTRPYAEPERRD